MSLIESAGRPSMWRTVARLREWKKPALPARPWETRSILEGGAVAWTVMLEATFGWGEVQSFEVGRLSRRMQV